MFTKNNALFKGNALEKNPLWCCDESPSPPAGKRVKVVTPILLFMLEKILYFWFPSQDTHETCLLAPLIPKRGTPSTVPSVGFKVLSNSLKLITYEFKGIGPLLVFILLELPLPLNTLHSLLQILSLWSLFTYWDYPIVSSYLSAPSPSSPSLTIQCLSLLLNVVFSTVPPWMIFSLWNLIHHFSVSTPRSVSAYQAAQLNT